nr:hypothetical protein [Tanacetum cinerariifolium]
MYSQMLCGHCLHNEVLRVGAVFASGFIRAAIKVLEKNWTTLCHDIWTGTLNPIITDPFVREAVMTVLKPDPKLSEFIEYECSKKSWQGIITREEKVIKVLLQALRSEFEKIRMKPDEPVSDYFSQVMAIVNKMRIHGDKTEGVEKILRSLTTKFNFVVCATEESKDVDKLSLDELQS